MKYPVPREIINQNVIVLGKTGAGKSTALRDLAEPMLAEGLPVCIIDPKGDWWGLKLSQDGKHEGFPVVIFGGKHADVPINESSGAAVAELFATGNRPCIIDLRGWMPGERTRFFIDFAQTMFKNTAGRRWLLIDECHNFAPKGKILDPNAGKMLHWANRLASEGRGLGLTLFGASQRPQKVHNDFLTSCETLIAMRVLHASDRVAYKDWIDGCGDPAKGKEMLAQIANLKRGTGYVWSPENEFGPELVRFPMFSTYDSFKPQEEGRADSLTGWPDVDLEDIKARMGESIAAAEANDPAALRREIQRLREQLARPKEPAVDVDALNRERSAGYMAGLQANVSVFFDLKKRLEAITADIQDFMELGPKLRIDGDGAPFVATYKHVQVSFDASPVKEEGAAAKFDPAGGEPMPVGEDKILSALIQHPEGLSTSELTVLCGYKRSSRDTYLQRLKAKGWVQGTGATGFQATAAGKKAIPYLKPLPTGKALQDHWLRKLPAGEKAILQVAINLHPRGVKRDSITLYKRSSRDTYIQRLVSKKLLTIAESGHVRASDTLF